VAALAVATTTRLVAARKQAQAHPPTFFALVVPTKFDEEFEPIEMFYYYIDTIIFH
jgi:hypothetical protein